MRTVSVLLILTINGGLTSPMISRAPQTSNAPQPSFLLSIQALQQTVKQGSPVSVKITKEDISDHEINNSVIKGELPYQIDVKDDQGNPRSETDEFRQIKKSRSANQDRSFSVIFASLKPGESASDQLDVNKYYDFSQPGKYTIQVSETDPESKTAVKSNIVTITITR